MSIDTDVVVLGAGPVGLTLANELVRHGLRPLIVDKAPGIREVSKAMILHVRTQEVLDKVGIAARARDEAQPLTEVVVHAYGKHIGSWDLDNIESPYRHPVIIGQNRTQHLLLDQLRNHGIEVGWNTEAISVQIAADNVATNLRHADQQTGRVTENVVQSRFIVGCEGSNSLVRRALNFTFEGERYTGEQFIQADCRIKWALPKGRSYLFLTPDGYMMVIEFPDDIVRIFISLPDRNLSGAGAKEAATQLGAAESTTEEPTLEEISQNLERLSGFRCELSDPVWLARYRTSHRYSNRFSQDRAFIAGDAGHVHVPIGGQGMNTGIQDAFNLAWKLAGVAKGELQQDILESYHEERHPVAANLINGTNFAYTGILHPSELKQHAARLFGPFLIRNQHVQSFMRSTLEELNIFYPDSRLNLDLGGATGPKPGERVLDSTLVRAADKATVTINEITRGTAWILLLFAGTSNGGSMADDLKTLTDTIVARHEGKVAVFMIQTHISEIIGVPSDENVLFDVLHIAHETYGVTGPAFYVFRPDTFVAVRGPISYAAELLEYFDRVFAAKPSSADN